MAGLVPTFTLTAGGLRSTTREPAGGPTRIVVDRDMDVACDAVRVELAGRAGVTPGDPIEVALGHDGAETTVFTGEVAAVLPTLRGTQLCALGVMTALLRLHAAATYVRRAAGDVVRDLVGRAGLQAGSVDAGPTLPRYAVHPGATAHAHVRALADRLGLELYADRAGRVMFHAPAVTAAGEPYAYGRHLLDAAARLRDPDPIAIRVGGESPMSAQGEDTGSWLVRDDTAPQGTAGPPGAAERVVLDPVARTTDLADRFATGRWTVRARARRWVRLTVLGAADADLGDPVAAAGSPDDALDGAGYVRALRHVFGVEDGFVTELTVAAGGRG